MNYAQVDYENQQIYHHGVKGQKWGVRKDDRGRINGKFIEDMSDDELRQTISRIQMEKQLSQLTAERSKGKDYISKIVKTTTTVAAVTGSAVKIYENINKIKKATATTK